MPTTKLFALLLSVAFCAGNAAASDFLADRHAARGVQCASCHIDGAPTADNASMEACLKCHGSYADVIARTADKGDINFHETHMGEIGCRECHHGHRPSSLVCDQCHEFTAKVP